MNEADLAWKRLDDFVKGKNKELIVEAKYRALALKGSVQTRALRIKQNRGTYGKGC